MAKAINTFAFPKQVYIQYVDGGLAVTSDHGVTKALTKRIVPATGSEAEWAELLNRLVLYSGMQQALAGMILAFRKNDVYLNLPAIDKRAFNYAVAMLRRSRGTTKSVDIPSWNSVGDFMEQLDALAEPQPFTAEAAF